MSDVIEARRKLSELARELGARSQDLALVSRNLEPVEDEYRTFVDEFELGLLKRSEDEDGYRLPPAALRLKLAHSAMDPALLGRYIGLTKSRERLVQRIRDLKHEAEAQRSIVSALKAELEASS